MDKYLNKIFHGDCIDLMEKMPKASIDMIFADAPYNLQLGEKTLYRPEDQSKTHGVRDSWDSFSSVKEYDNFTYTWLSKAKQLLKPDGSIWVIGSYHNIFRLGTILQDLGFWILNDIIWIKNNPMPNFRGTRFTNAHETLIWAIPNKNSKYTFNYETMKKINHEKQMRSDWRFNICLGEERIKDKNGKTLHSTQKPMNLLRRIILASTKQGDIILDPFFGSGTTGAVAKELNRKFIGIEKETDYILPAYERIKNTNPINLDNIEVNIPKREEIKIPFTELIEAGLLHIGQTLVSPKGERVMITKDGLLSHALYGKASIHIMAAKLQNVFSFNGWLYWSIIRKDGSLYLIDELRKYYRALVTLTKEKIAA